MRLSVKAARVNSNMKAKDVAAHLGISLVAYSRKENGHTRFYANEAAQLARLFNMPYENFFEAVCLVETRTDTPLSYDE